MASVVAVAALVEVAASASAEVAAAVCAFEKEGRAPCQPIQRVLAKLARPTRPLWHHAQLAVVGLL